VLANTKQTKYAPNRAEVLQSQINVRDAENAIAQSARKVAAPAADAQSAATPPTSVTALSSRVVAVPASAMTIPATRSRVDAPAVMTPPGVWFVNNKEKNFTLTPGGYVTIVGKGFGDDVGKVSMFVLAQGGTLEIAFPVSEWHDREVYAFVPAGIRGIADQSTRLQVRTRSGTPYSLDTGTFYATREEITVNTGLGRVVQFSPSPSWDAALADNGRVDRSGEYCPKQAGADRLYFKPQANGFVVSSIAWWTGRQDTGDGDGYGNDGRRSFVPGYSFGEWGTGPIGVGRDRSAQVPTLSLNWGVWCSYSYRSGFSSNETESNYQIEVSLVGPAGLRPF
jgi:hypothetical protein